MDVGVVPLLRNDKTLTTLITLLSTKLPPGLLLLVLRAVAGAGGRTATAIAGGRDVTVQGAVLVEVAIIRGAARMVTILHVGSIGDSPLRHFCCCWLTKPIEPNYESGCCKKSGREMAERRTIL